MRPSRRAALAIGLAVVILLPGSSAPARGGKPGTGSSATWPSRGGTSAVRPVPRFSASGDRRSAPGGTPGERPSFVFVLTDDLDSASLRYLPMVRRLLVERGTTLSRYYVSLPWCCPSRATTLRGQYAHNTGIWTVSPPRGGFVAFHQAGHESSTIATWLRDAGYRTGLFGKYLNGYHNGYPQGPKKRTYIPPGWTTWVVPAAGNPYHGFDYTLNIDGHLKRYDQARGEHLTDVLGKAARQFVTADDARPFLAYVAPYSPHRPATPAARHAGMFPAEVAPRTPAFDAADMTGKPAVLRRLPRVSAAERDQWDALYRNRLRSLQAVDEMVASLVRGLRLSGRLDTTYFVFTSDNGFHIGQHRLAPGKNTPYEEDVRVPFVVRGPGVPEDRTVDSLAGNVDIAPTLADLAGIAPPGFVDGRSLGPVLRQGTPPTAPPWRTAYLLEQGSIPGAKSSSKHREKVYLPPFSGLRTARYLYVEYVTGESELYDVIKDPQQINNIAPGNPITARFSARLHRLRSCAAQSCRAIEVAP